MQLKRYSDLSTFERKFHELCVERDDGESIYYGFTELCRDLLPDRIVSDEDRLNLDAWVTCRRHARRTQLVFYNLFRQYRNILAGSIDLVVWGCGCGIDLVALYSLYCSTIF